MKYYTGDGSVSLDEIYGLNHDPDASGGITHACRVGEEWGVPKCLVPIAGDGHTWVALDYRSSKDDPSVVFYIADSGEQSTIAPDFEVLLKNLVILPDGYTHDDE